ncbi:MAG: hypothetical protein HY820_10210 [Acidobacteria bacterium]|nr:hypothetical protein [Acidobacteriota bacterium]
MDFFKVDPATAAKLTGHVTFKGKAPAAKRISMEAEEDCAALHKTPVFEDKVILAKDGSLANAFVYVKTGLEGKTFPPAETAVVMEQKGCQFLPRVLALRTGQTFTVRNADPVSHNIHPMPKNNRDWNQQQTPGAPDLQRRFAYPEVMIPVKCNIHNWMRAFVAVLPHPYYAITAQDGKFTIDNLPPGQYTVAVWHEAFGELSHELRIESTTPPLLTFAFAP